MLLDLGTWVPILDGDPIAAAMYDRHYSSERSRARRAARGTLQFVGPSERLVLMTPDRSALFAWRRHDFRADGMSGVECSIFRNEGDHLSSDLIRAADALADRRWPGQLHFSYVDEGKTAARRSRYNAAGACFAHAGWRLLERRSQERGLRLLVREP